MDIERRDGRGLGLGLWICGAGESVDAREQDVAADAPVDVVEEVPVEGLASSNAPRDGTGNGDGGARYLAPSGGSLYSGLPDVSIKSG